MVLGIFWVILFIFVISIALSVRILLAIRDGQIVKHIRFLKWMNLIHIFVFVLFLISIYPLADYYGRDGIVSSFHIYALFGVTALISNIVVLVGQYVKKNNSGK